jgi:hypothetical protein
LTATFMNGPVGYASCDTNAELKTSK